LVKCSVYEALALMAGAFFMSANRAAARFVRFHLDGRWPHFPPPRPIKKEKEMKTFGGGSTAAREKGELPIRATPTLPTTVCRHVLGSPIGIDGPLSARIIAFFGL
jgi:hypothetical protein